MSADGFGFQSREWSGHFGDRECEEEKAESETLALFQSLEVRESMSAGIILAVVEVERNSLAALGVTIEIFG